MKTVTRVAAALCVALSVPFSLALAQQAPRPIPGINAEDPFPGGCVDCHVADPEHDLDHRFSTLFRLWKESPDPDFLARMQPLAPAGVTLTGAHPTAAYSLANIPESCLSCHGPDSEKAPELGPMVHTIHLSPDPENVFMTRFQGQCTFCHKLDPASGTWSHPSGPER